MDELDSGVLELPGDGAVLTATASEALLVAIRTAVSAGGDEAVVLESGFDAYPGLIEMCGAVPRFAARSKDEHLSPALVFDEIGPRTAAVLLTQRADHRRPATTRRAFRFARFDTQRPSLAVQESSP